MSYRLTMRLDKICLDQLGQLIEQQDCTASDAIRIALARATAPPRPVAAPPKPHSLRE